MFHGHGINSVSGTTSFMRRMNMTAQQAQAIASRSVRSGHCPFFDREQSLCRAALLTYSPDFSHRSHYCCSDDHDDCALFLAKALRSSTPGGLDRDVTVHCGK
jgi:hypothetical protein